MSVMEGHSYTLQTGVKTKEQETIRWYFNDICIAQITGDLRYICTDVQCNGGNERFRGRLKLDHQTGSLTITNIRTTDTGDYELKINSSRFSENTFMISVYGESLCLKTSLVHLNHIINVCSVFFVFFCSDIQCFCLYLHINSHTV